MTTITALQYSTMDNILTLFDEQVSCSPDSIALLYADQGMTYHELNQRANQLAWHLQKLDVKPEALVGVCTSRSLDMIVAILGVLKAGGAYVPLDPSYPQERLSFILEDTQAPIVITQNEFSASFSGQQVLTVCMDVDWPEIGANSMEPPSQDALPENLAYVIYTSGSTGRPKGVMVTHSNLLNFIRISSQALDVYKTDVYLQTASIAYALSVRQIMIPLCMGATLVIATAEEMRDPLLMFELIKRWKVSLMDMVPSFWRTCLQRLADLPSDELNTLMDNALRRIVSIGEPLLSDIPQEWASRFGYKTQLVNIFGQTETTGVVAMYPIPFQTPTRMKVVPIGSSIPDTRLYLLDSNLQPVSAGEQGELCVSNPCIARGYLNYPEFTSQKFVPNPFQDGLSCRLYRTGDMARMREDGCIEFLGRGDQQVKIRGQRLELGEVEVLLRDNPSVQDCVVVARGSHPDEKYLVAYIIPAAGNPPSISVLKDFVRRRVPDYMVPSVFVFLDVFPLLPNGKLDRLALPDPGNHEFKNVISDEGDNQPGKPVEQAVATIWRELLNLDHVDIHDNFFDLGGHSLAVVRLFSRIERQFGVRLPSATILHASTVALLAELIQNYQPEDDSNVLIPIQTAGHGNPLFLVHGVGGGLLGYRDLVKELGKDRPVYGLQAVGLNNQDAFDQSVEEMASHYVKVMRSFQPKGPFLLGGYCFGGVIAYQMACELEKQGEDVALLAMFEGVLPAAKEHRIPFRKRVIVFLQSLPNWIKDYARMSPDELRYRASSTFAKIWLKIKHQPDLQRRIRVQEILDTELNLVPHRSVELTQIHSTALHRYHPEIYGGKVTVFRARNRSVNDVVFGSLDPTMGWGDFVQGGVEVKMVDGFHRNIHLSPYVASLASELRQCFPDITKGGWQDEL